MRTHHIRHQNGDLGIVWFLVPMVWAAIALVGFALVSNWPELFAPEQPAASMAKAAPDAATRESMRQGGAAPAASPEEATGQPGTL